MTAANNWTTDELAAIDATGEVDVATRCQDGTLRTAASCAATTLSTSAP